MIAKVRSGSDPGEVIYLSVEDFEKAFTRQVGDRTYCISDDAVWWSKNGRIGSHWQVGNVMYIRVNDQEDPFQYYTPPEKKNVIGIRPWGVDSVSGCGSGNKGGSGCSGGCHC